MIRRSKKNATRKNDGLPFVNTGRRSKGYETTETNNSYPFWLKLMVVVILILFLTEDAKDEELVQSDNEAMKTATAAPKPATTAPKPATTAPKPATTAPKPATTAPKPATTETKPPAEIFPPGKYPPQCTAEELSQLAKQLPNPKECNVVWGDCSYTEATVRTEFAVNRQLVREFYSSDDFKLKADHSFFAVDVVWTKDDVPIDSLLIGSRDPKYDVKEFNKQLGLDDKKALPPVAITQGAAKRPAKSLVISFHNMDKIQGAKESMKLSDDELRLVPISRDSIKSINEYIKTNMPSTNGKVAADQPVHYLDMSGMEATEITGLNSIKDDVLKNVRYLHMDSNKGGSWNVKVPDVMKSLKEAGLVCYWVGKKETDYSLWRITDCILDSYNVNHWSTFACVSAVHDDVAGLADRMEKKFKETLQKDQVITPRAH